MTSGHTDLRLRILHLLLASDPGGLSRYVIELAGAMREQGHEICVAGDKGEAHGMFEEAGIDYIRIPLRGGPFSFLKSATLLRRHLRQKPVDVLHTHYRRATLLARRLQVRTGMFSTPGPTPADQSTVPADRRPWPPILYTLHLSHISLAGPRRWLSDFGDHTHAASEDARRWLIDAARVPSGRITLIPHGIKAADFPRADEPARAAARQMLGLGPAGLVASYVGRFDNPKNESWVLDLASATRAELPHVHFLLVGGGPNEPALRDRIDSENLHDRVHVLGHRPPLPVYQATDLLLLPSAREGFSLVCGEAMSVGVPVLRTRTSGVHELIIEGVTGRSTPIDRDAFIDAAILMLHDVEGLKRMGAAAARHVHGTLTYDRQLSQTIELYSHLGGRDRPEAR
jgi:glycosyltransferase involved in cell wall biosynthesis